MNYHNITTDDMLNGEGVRTVLWVAGCEHHCKGCQNPVTWDVNGGLEFDIYAEAELYNNLYKDHISGTTFSGGDPLHPKNRDTIFRLAREIKERIPGKTVWLYTGYLWEEIRYLRDIVYIDVIVDGKFIESLKDNSYHWAGSTNQRVVDVWKSIIKGGECVLLNQE